MQVEYKVLRFTERHFLSGQLDTAALEKELDQLGKESWELVNMIAIGAIGIPPIYAIFKKPKD